ncbi:MAG: hypothetical protein ACI9W1_003423, partial [Candidatus Azotimanducaceae bacterium]
MTPGSQANMPPLDNYRGIIAYFARNPVASNLLMVILLVGGLLA